MNPDIATLFKLPRGKSWRSRLTAHDKDIRQWREAGESYRQITIFIKERGLEISRSSVHSYVRARAKMKRPQYCLPDGNVESRIQQVAQPNHPIPDDKAIVHEETRKVTAKKFVFVPEPRKQESQSDDESAFNDPFDLNH